MNAYDEFLARKARRHQSDGVDVTLDPAEQAHMHPWQTSIVQWALHRGRAAVFADTGLGKSRMQVAWAHHVADRSLILAPLSVARQTVREAAKIGVDVRYVRDPADVQTGVSITNYEMAHKFDPAMFGAVALDESSILKCFTGATRTALIRQWADTPYRSSWSATPAPNDVTELCNQAEFLGVMPRREMLAAYFVHDDDGWRLKGHAADPMFRWMSSWATALRRPSDIGGDDAGYDLPPLNIIPVAIESPLSQDGQLFATDLGGVGGRAAIRRATTDTRVARVMEIVDNAHQRRTTGLQPSLGCEEPGPHSGVPSGDSGSSQRSTSGAVCPVGASEAGGSGDSPASRLCGEEPWIVWCGLNDEQDQLARHFGDRCFSVYGSLSPEEKADRIEAWQDGERPILLTKPSVCGFGLNLQRAHQMVFVGLNDSWESYYQSIRRCWRFGQAHPVDVHIVVSTLEMQIVDNVRRKEHEVARWVDRLIYHCQENTSSLAWSCA